MISLLIKSNKFFLQLTKKLKKKYNRNEFNNGFEIYFFLFSIKNKLNQKRVNSLNIKSKQIKI